MQPVLRKVCTGPESQRSLDVGASLLRMNPYGRRPSQERNSEHGERTLRSTGPLIMAPDAAEEGMTRRVEARAGLASL